MTAVPSVAAPARPAQRVIERLRAAVDLLTGIRPEELVGFDGPEGVGVPGFDPELAQELVELAGRAGASVAAIRQGALVAYERACAHGCGCHGCRQGLPGCLDSMERASVEVGVLLRLHHRTVHGHLGDAHDVIEGLPLTFAKALAGQVAPHQVNALVDAVAHLDTHERRQAEEILHFTDDIGEQTRAQIRRRATRVALGIRAPESPEDLEKDACLRTGPARTPGLAEWFAVLPAGRAMQAEQVIDQHARELARATGATIENSRATALLDLILGQARVERVVELVVPLHANILAAACLCQHARTTTASRALGHGPESDTHGPHPAAVVATHGPHPAAVVATHDPSCPAAAHAPLVAPAIGVDTSHGILLAQQLNEFLTDPDIRVRLAGLDPTTDAVVVTDPHTYRPNAATVRHVRSRDGSCRFPQCTTPARQCEIDHVIPFPEGRTEPDNLMALCTRHHAFKHHSRWTVTLARDGTATWTAPDGRTHITTPQDTRRTAL